VDVPSVVQSKIEVTTHTAATTLTTHDAKGISYEFITNSMESSSLAIR